MYRTIWQKDLSSMKCDNPDCTEEHSDKMFVHPVCHRGAGLEVFFENGFMKARCKFCEAPVVMVLVPPKELDYVGLDG